MRRRRFESGPVLLIFQWQFFAGSSNGRTGLSEGLDVGSIPAPAARRRGTQMAKRRSSNLRDCGFESHPCYDEVVKWQTRDAQNVVPLRRGSSTLPFVICLSANQAAGYANLEKRRDRESREFVGSTPTSATRGIGILPVRNWQADVGPK